MRGIYAIAKGVNTSELESNIQLMELSGMIQFGVRSFDAINNCYSQPMIKKVISGVPYKVTGTNGEEDLDT